MHNDDGRPTWTKRPGHLHFLPGSWSADLLILSTVDGLSSPPSPIGWVLRAVWGILWSDMGRDSFLSPSQKTSASLSSPAGSHISLTSVNSSISAARLPPCGYHWKCRHLSCQGQNQILSDSVCNGCCAVLNLVTGWCHFMRMCQGNVGGHEAALFENYSAPFLKGIKVRQKKRINAK